MDPNTTEHAPTIAPSIQNPAQNLKFRYYRPTDPMLSSALELDGG
jgi:hypothetical protein